MSGPSQPGSVMTSHGEVVTSHGEVATAPDWLTFIEVSQLFRSGEGSSDDVWYVYSVSSSIYSWSSIGNTVLKLQEFILGNFLPLFLKRICEVRH